ncbi:hypothetical protein ACMFMG_000390 [Clarireedia jacksonii]
MSMRIVPPTAHSTSYSHLTSTNLSAPSAPGVHDTLRSGLGPTLQASSSLSTSKNHPAPVPESAHPLEARLLHWTATQHSLKQTGLRRTFGLSEPIRREMELKIVKEGEWRPLVLGGGRPGVHEEILRGTDTGIEWEDVFTGEEMRGVMGVQEEMERKVGMGRL